MVSNRALRVETAEDSKTMLMGVLDNQAGPARDIVMLNAGAALYAANVSNSIQAGVLLAKTAIESGAAKAKLTQLATITKQLTPN
jgi:anthranilate phosphoribosyltransferase